MKALAYWKRRTADPPKAERGGNIFRGVIKKNQKKSDNI